MKFRGDRLLVAPYCFELGLGCITNRPEIRVGQQLVWHPSLVNGCHLPGRSFGEDQAESDSSHTLYTL